MPKYSGYDIKPKYTGGGSIPKVIQKAYKRKKKSVYRKGGSVSGTPKSLPGGCGGKRKKY
tara:strand:+ start:464 stop:643 length:180 start_codon:yes stop_codon:yes gene_type:complete